MPDLTSMKARAATIQKSLQDRKIDPDILTAVAMVYLAMKILKMPAEEILQHGPLGIALSKIFDDLVRTASGPSVNSADPNATVTMTNAQLAQLLHSIGTGKIGEA